MTKKDFLVLIENIIEMDPNTLSGNELISDLERWDSLTVVSFIAMVDEKFSVTLSPQKISAAKSIQDLVVLLGDRIIS